MDGIKVYKKEIKEQIREELKCDYGFIKHLIKWGVIQKLQDAYADPVESKAYSEEIMEEIYQLYKEYCDVWGLDTEEDNRNNKEYLCR